MSEKTKTRIYTVRNTLTDAVRLVRAANTTQARNHVARDIFTAAVATQDELLQLAGNVKVEEVGADPAE